MRSLPGFVFSAAAMLMTGAAIVPAEPARAAVSFNLDFGFNYFHDRLADRGRWVSSPIWGDVWQPGRRFVGADFQPYTNGYWEYTDEYGWYWVSDDPFDDVVYHYGRWVYDPDMSWVWIPGYTRGPGWVVWREGDGYSGWLPMPPDEAFISGNGLSLGMNFGSSGVNFYGYDRWYGNRVDPDRFWVFVDNRNLANRDYRRFVVPRERAKALVTSTRNVTKFEVVNNRVVNRSIDVKIVERASGRRIAPVPAREVIKANAIVTTVDESNRVRERERVQHPIRADFTKGATGAKGNQPGNASGRPGGAMTGGAAQTNGAAEGGKRDRSDVSGNGGAMTGGAAQTNGAAEGGKHDRNDGSGGNTSTGASGATGGEQSPDNDTATRNPRNLSNGSSDSNAGTIDGAQDRTNPGAHNNGTMTGPQTGGQPSSSNGSTDVPRRAHNANPGGAMGTENSGQNTASPSGTSSGANRTPRNNGATTGPTGNVPAQQAEPKHQPQNPAGNPNGSHPTGASNGQQPDNSGNEQKKKKHNPPGTTPAPGTPQ